MDERFLISTNYKLLLFIRNNKWIISALNASPTSACYCAQEDGLGEHTLFPVPLLNKTASLHLKKTLQSSLTTLKSNSHSSLSLYLKSRKKYIIRNVDKKPSPLCPVISFRCLDPSSIMAIVLISTPPQSSSYFTHRVGSRSLAQRTKWNSPQRSRCTELNYCADLRPFFPVAHASNHLLKTISYL